MVMGGVDGGGEMVMGGGGGGMWMGGEGKSAWRVVWSIYTVVRFLPRFVEDIVRFHHIIYHVALGDLVEG